MSIYRATNLKIDSSVQTITGGTSAPTGTKLLAQFQIPDNQSIRLIEFGYSQDQATATSTLLKLQTTDTGSTLTTAFSTTLIKPVYSNDSRASSLTMATTGTAMYANGDTAALPTSRTSIRDVKSLYVPQVYEYEWPLGREPIVGNTTTENFLQVLVNTTATVNVIWWLVWDEL